MVIRPLVLVGVAALPFGRRKLSAPTLTVSGLDCPTVPMALNVNVATVWVPVQPVAVPPDVEDPGAEGDGGVVGAAGGRVVLRGAAFAVEVGAGATDGRSCSTGLPLTVSTWTTAGS